MHDTKDESVAMFGTTDRPGVVGMLVGGVEDVGRGEAVGVDEGTGEG